KSFAATGDASVDTLAVRGSDIVVVGSFSGVFGGTTGQPDGAWLAKLSATTGDPIWQRAFSSTAAVSARGAAVDTAGRIIETGWLKGAVDFGGGPISPDGDWNVYLASFQADGSFDFSDRFGSGDVRGFSLAVGGNDEIFVGGTVYSGVLGLPGADPATR